MDDFRLSLNILNKEVPCCYYKDGNCTNIMEFLEIDEYKVWPIQCKGCLDAQATQEEHRYQHWDKKFNNILLGMICNYIMSKLPVKLSKEEYQEFRSKLLTEVNLCKIYGNKWDIDKPDFVTIQNLVQVCSNKLIPQIKDKGYTHVIGVPRSGLLPANIISLFLGLPLFTISEQKIVPTGFPNLLGGIRTENLDFDFLKKGKGIIIDDTVAAGSTKHEIQQKFSEDFGCVYLNPEFEGDVDMFGEYLQLPHILEWNFFDSALIEESIFDIDGVLCANLPKEIDHINDEDSYITWMSTVKPIYRNTSNKFTIQKIVTGRLDKYREHTKKWLQKNNIKYKELVMFPTDQQSDRDKNHAEVVALMKAKEFSQSDARFFVESELNEAQLIKSMNKRYVICTNGGTDYQCI